MYRAVIITKIASIILEYLTTRMYYNYGHDAIKTLFGYNNLQGIRCIKLRFGYWFDLLTSLGE